MFKLSPTKFFVYCALIFGIILITLIPPFQSPDEDSHFKRAYVLSRGGFYPTTQNGIVGFYLPNDMTGYINQKLTYIGNRDQKYTYSEEILDDRLPKDYSSESFQNFSTVEMTPIVYIAPAAGIVFAKISAVIIGAENISVTFMLYFARLFCLLLYITLVAIAIKITPILKKTFCMIGLIPMGLSLAAAISYDSVLIALTMLSTALIFKIIFDDNIKKISFKYLIMFGIIGFILLTVKTVYITVLLPLIFIPKEKYGDSFKGIIKKLILVVGIAIGCYIVNKIPYLFLAKSAGDNSIPGQQLQFVVHNPLTYVKILLSEIWNGRNYYFTGMFGIFGLTDTYLPTVYTVTYLFAFICIVIADLSLCSEKFNWKYKIVALLGSMASIVGIFSAMYILWTSMLIGIGGNTITGVQGRYFLPIIPLSIVLFSNSFMIKNLKIKRLLEIILENSYLVFFIMLIVSMITILLRYWC